jgi:hypothetical protein
MEWRGARTLRNQSPRAVKGRSNAMLLVRANRSAGLVASRLGPEGAQGVSIYLICQEKRKEDALKRRNLSIYLDFGGPDRSAISLAKLSLLAQIGCKQTTDCRSLRWRYFNLNGSSVRSQCYAVLVSAPIWGWVACGVASTLTTGPPAASSLPATFDLKTGQRNCAYHGSRS